MNARTAERIESGLDAGAALLLAAAVGYVLSTLAVAQTAVAGAGVAFGLCFVSLRRIQPGKPAGSTEGSAAKPVADLLAEADRSLAHAEDELVLDDVLAVLNPDSRVVRLFERDAMPTPGEIQSRIDHHLGAQAKAPDASQALHDALFELRRSLK